MIISGVSNSIFYSCLSVCIIVPSPASAAGVTGLAGMWPLQMRGGPGSAGRAPAMATD